jgi:hypothetical protein
VASFLAWGAATAAHRTAHVTGVQKDVIRGMPDPKKISTSYVERFNLSSRMQVALWVSFYNLCRVHETLRCTPAMTHLLSACNSRRKAMRGIGQRRIADVFFVSCAKLTSHPNAASTTPLRAALEGYKRRLTWYS